MQLDPGPKSSRVVKDAGLGAAMSYQPKRRTSLWNKTLKILGLFLVVFFVTELLLYEKLTGALSHAKGASQTRHAWNISRGAHRGTSGISWLLCKTPGAGVLRQLRGAWWGLA